MRRWGLTATFAVVSLLAMAAVGALLIVAMSRQARSYALSEAVRTADAYVTAGVPLGQSVQASLTGPVELPTDLQHQIRRLVNESKDQGQALEAIRLWDANSQLVFATDAKPNSVAWDNRELTRASDFTSQQGRGLFPDGLRLDQALEGQPAAKVVEEFTTDPDGTLSGAGTRQLSVYLPALTDPQNPQRALGVVEVVLNYKATEAAVAGAVKLITLLVLFGLVVLWLLLFRTVANASRRLRRHAVENARLALLDPLTGLPNRRLLDERIDRAVLAAGRSKHQLALLLLDVDEFKDINDTLGHDFGDQLLIEVAHRIRAVARETDTVARLGGDEFAVLMPLVDSTDDALALVARIQQEFARTFVFEGITLHVDCSIGVALLPEHADDRMTLMRHADVAMYAAKRAKIGSSIYSAEGDHHSAARLTLMGDLRRALEVDDQLVLNYQPKVDLRTGTVVGLEALLRWDHPTLGRVRPDHFIPAAEKTGLITDLTQRVLEQAVAQLSRWAHERAEVPLDVAVNLSARNLHEPDLIDRVRLLLNHAHVSAASLEVEITESAIPSDPGQARGLLDGLAALGARIALDDFGSGNTSISQLLAFPLTTLKIDRGFVAPLASDPGSVVLVRAMVELAHEFGLLTVAEGVEDEAVAEVLRELGCDLAQGYLWSRPVPAAEVPSVVGAVNGRADRAVVAGAASTSAATSGSRRTGPRPGRT